MSEEIVRFDTKSQQEPQEVPAEEAPEQAAQVVTEEQEVATQAAPVEVAEVEEKETVDPALEEQKKAEDEFQKRFAALSKRERDLYQKHRLIKEQEKELERLRGLESKFKENPYKAVEDLGGSYEDWTKKILNDGEPAPEDKLKSLESKIEDIYKEKEDNKAEAQNQQRYQTYVNELKSIEKNYTDNSEKYPLVNLFGDTQLVFDIRAEKFKQDQDEYGFDYAKQNVMSTDEALQMAEGYREEMIKSRKESLKGTKSKIDKLLEIKPTDTKEEVQEKQALKEAMAGEESAQPQNVNTLPEKTRKLMGVKTLSNKQPVPAKERKAFTNDRERLAHAAQMLRYNDESYTGVK